MIQITLDPDFLIGFVLLLGLFLALFIGGALAVDPIVSFFKGLISDHTDGNQTEDVQHPDEGTDS